MSMHELRNKSSIGRNERRHSSHQGNAMAMPTMQLHVGGQTSVPEFRMASRRRICGWLRCCVRLSRLTPPAGPFGGLRIGPHTQVQEHEDDKAKDSQRARCNLQRRAGPRGRFKQKRDDERAARRYHDHRRSKRPDSEQPRKIACPRYVYSLTPRLPASSRGLHGATNRRISRQGVRRWKPKQFATTRTIPTAFLVAARRSDVRAEALPSQSM